MKIFVDIDETICYYEGKRDYKLAKPIPENIEKINKLYDKKHTIIYWTARGTTTGINWNSLTVKQLISWGVKFNEVRMGKPDYDLFICDKATDINNLEDKIGDLK